MKTQKITNQKKNKSFSAVNNNNSPLGASPAKAGGITAPRLNRRVVGIEKFGRNAQKSEVLNPQLLNKALDLTGQNKKKPKVRVTEKSKDKFLYVYGIIARGSFKLKMTGLQNQPIQKIDFEGISALVSFYPHLHPAVEEQEAMQHAEILNTLAQKTTIIPMAFGTVFKEQEILETVLAKTYPTIEKTLESIKGKIELGVKVIKKESEDVSRETSQKILEELNPLSVKSLAGDKFSDRLILNQSFLVDKNKLSHFSNKIARLEKKYPDLTFRYTGPWPAYSFVNINIGVN